MSENTVHVFRCDTCGKEFKVGLDLLGYNIIYPTEWYKLKFTDPTLPRNGETCQTQNHDRCEKDFCSTKCLLDWAKFKHSKE